MGYLIIFLILLVFIKLLYLYFIFKHLYFKTILLKEPKNVVYKDTLERTKSYKDQIETIFKIMMALLFIYIFNPMQQNEKYIGKEIKNIIFIFGFIIILETIISKKI
jgi:hypothetical protein